MELITTHVGADFDALASTLVARKLFPGARIFFPGSKEESVRRMLASGYIELDEVRQKQIDPEALTRVVLCDIRQPDRIGAVAGWLRDRPAIELLIWDHHPAGEADLVGVGGRVDPAAGSTSTLLVEELRRRGDGVTRREATVLLMGIYEDTGSLSFATTGPRDLAAAAWLLEAGGDLAAVRRFALRRLDARRLEVLHQMTESLEIYRRGGHRIGVVALELGGFIDELAPLAGRCLELFELPLLFAIFGEGERVTVIARGDREEVHLGKLLDELAGGGGHATAASASLKGMTVLEVREALLALLDRRLPPAARARDLMLRRFEVLAAGTTVEEAKQRLVERRVNAAPVVEAGAGGRVVGAVTRQLLDGALQHGLGERPVESVMERDLEWVSPDEPAEAIAARMMGRHPRFVLVGERAGGRPEGLATRMQVLRHLYGRLEETTDPLGRRAREHRLRRAAVGRLLRERLAPGVARRLEAAATVAAEEEMTVYLVGGLVRDLLLGRDNRDVDLVVEGDGPHFARRLGRRLGGRVRVHEPFLTAVVVDEEEFHIDVATARSEFYRAPAALPEVRTSILRQDLYRRDFTINTLAIRLGPWPEGELIDYFGGRRDLEDGTLRVLHSLSFLDDPTRVLRAVRLEARLGFTISPETLRLIELAVAEGVFERLSGTRLRDELVRLLDDAETAVAALERLEELAVLPAIQPGLELDEAARQRLRHAAAALDWYRFAAVDEPPVPTWRLFLGALTWDLERRDRDRLIDRLVLAGEHRRVLAELRPRVSAAGATLRRPGLAPHAAAAAVRELAGDEQLLVMALGGEIERAWVRREMTEFRPLRLAIRGSDLVERGHPAGPAIGGALAATLEARIDGRIGPADELDYALERLAAGREE